VIDTTGRNDSAIPGRPSKTLEGCHGSNLRLTAALIALSGSAFAGVITWSLPTNTSGDSDVATAGALVDAGNLGASHTATINGVNFVTPHSWTPQPMAPLLCLRRTG